MGRQDGRKFKTHTLVVEGAPAEIHVRVTFDGEFFADWDGERHKASSYKDLIDKVEPKVRESRRRAFVPVIYAEQSGSTHDNDSHYYGNPETQEVGVRASVAWRSETTTHRERSWGQPEDVYQYIEGEVDEATGEMAALTEEARTQRHRFSNTTDPGVPFTKERWARILALKEAIVRVRGAVKEVLEDSSGKGLDALGPGLPMLAEVPKEPKKRRSR